MASDREAAEQALRDAGFTEARGIRWEKQSVLPSFLDLAIIREEGVAVMRHLRLGETSALVALLSAPADAITPPDALTPQQVERVLAAAKQRLASRHGVLADIIAEAADRMFEVGPLNSSPYALDLLAASIVFATRHGCDLRRLTHSTSDANTGEEGEVVE